MICCTLWISWTTPLLQKNEETIWSANRSGWKWANLLALKQRSLLVTMANNLFCNTQSNPKFVRMQFAIDHNLYEIYFLPMWRACSFSFFELLYREKWGPLYTLPYRYNVRHASLIELNQSGKGDSWEESLLTLFLGYFYSDLGTKPSGPAIVHSTTIKPYQAKHGGCDRVAEMYWEAAIWAHATSCQNRENSSEYNIVCGEKATQSFEKMASSNCHYNWTTGLRSQ